MGLWGAIGAGIQTVGSIFQNKRNIDFQKRENRITRKREDNAVQRRAKDMEAAGLNKVLAAGDPASAQALQAPQQGANIGAAGVQGARPGDNYAEAYE